MLPVVLTAAFVMLPPNETALRHLVWIKPRTETAADLLAEKLRVEARELREEKKPADALPLFNAAVLLRPDDYTTRVGRAKTFAALGRHDEEADEYTALLARYPGSWIAWCDVAEGWIDRGRWDEAGRCFERAVELTPAGELRFSVLVHNADCWLGKDSKSDDVKQLPRVRLMRAHLALCDAVEHSAEVSRSAAARQYAFAHRAWLRHAIGWLAEAAADYDEVLKLLPTDVADVHAVQAKIAFELKDYEKVLVHAAAAKKFGGDPILSAQIRCKTLIKMADYERAEQAAADWVQLAAEDEDAAFFRAITLRLRGHDDEADQETERSAKLRKREIADQVYAEMYALWMWYEQHDATERLLTRRIASTPDTSELAAVYVNRAKLRRQRGLAEDVLDDLTACVRLRPHCFDTRALRANAAIELWRYDVALEDAEVLTRLWPFDPDGHKLLAEARGAIKMAAAIADREPDYRPAGPLVAMPRNYSFGAGLMAAYLPNR